MAIYYNGAHAITVVKCKEADDSIIQNHSIDRDLRNVKNTWKDFYLVPSSRPYVDTPKPRLQFVTLPRSNRILDLSTSLTNDITYEAREGDWEFYIDHDKWSDWTEYYNSLYDYFNGDQFFISLDDQPEGMYQGIISIGSFKVGDDYSTVTLHYNLDSESYMLGRYLITY